MVGDSDLPVEHVSAGGTYAHSITLFQHMGLWALPVVVSSAIQDGEQLTYTQTEAPAEWKFNAVLLPNLAVGEKIEYVECRHCRSRQNVITTTVASDTGFEDAVSLEIPVK